MRFVAGAMLSGALLVSHLGGTPVEVGGLCGFSVVQTAPQLRTVGPDNVVARVRTRAQQDSPVAITAADFTGSSLAVSPGFFTWHPRYSLEIQNVSDQSLTDVRVTVFLQGGFNSGGVGDTPTAKGPLAPGARVTLSGGHGPGRGTAHGDEVSVQLIIESMRIGSCEYRPSQSIAFPR